MTILKHILLYSILYFFLILQNGCNFLTHRTISKDAVLDSTNTDPEPNYDISLDNNYQDFTSYLYPGNRVENFTAYFNTHFKAEEDYDEAMAEYRTSLINEYNRQLDSLGIIPPVSGTVKEKLNKSIERASKIIQFHKNSKYIDNAVLLIGKSYYYLEDYLNAERKFNEFLSKLSSSENADEAILFLGRTKVRIGKKEEGEVILSNLLKSTDDKEIKSLTVRDLGVLAYNKGDVADATIDFKASIDYSNDNERKAESQFILAKIITLYKPEQSAKEYQKVLEYTSDFDLTFFAKLNSAKGLIYIKQFANADETLTNLRKKYRDFPAYTQLVDLEIANNLYAQNKLKDAYDKYYDIIVKYPNSVASSDSYYYIAKHKEEVNNDYLNALLNYKKSVEENSGGDFHKESEKKVAMLEKYFSLLGEVKDSVKINIPTTNADVEKYRKKYNEEKGIEQPTENGNGVINEPGNKGTLPGDEGNNPNANTGNPRPKGQGKGHSGGVKGFNFEFLPDSSENEGNSPLMQENPPVIQENPPVLQENPDQNFNPGQTGKEEKTKSETNPSKIKNQGKEDSSAVTGNFNSDSANAAAELIKAKNKEEKEFNSYYELAELFIYSLQQKDSAERYLNILLTTFPDPQKQAKVLYTLANFYKNNDKKEKADDIFNKIISDYPNTVYAFESKKIMGIIPNESDIKQNPVDETFNKALGLYREKKYKEAISVLYEIENKFPNDSAVAKAYYGLGFIYENDLINKDSSLYYFKKLKTKYPNSEYALKVTPMLDYIASVEVKDTSAISDSTKIVISDSTKNIQEVTDSLKTEKIQEKPKEENTEEVVAPPGSNIGTENNLSQEEIDRLLKETETPTDK